MRPDGADGQADKQADGQADGHCRPGGPADPRRVLAWAPGIAEPAEPVEPIVYVEPPVRAEPEALAGISLHTPVSVTPPSSWRKAAWFIVGAASIVLVVLVFAAMRLAGPEDRIGRIDAFPGLPTGGLLTPQQPEAAEPAATAEPPAPDEPGSSPSVESAPGGDGGATVPQAPGGTEPGRPGENRPPGQSGGSGGGSRPTEGRPEPTGGAQPTSPGTTDVEENVVDSTHRFFGFLPHDLEAAWEMVSPRVRVLGFEAFREQWGQYSDVRLQHVEVGTDGTTVVATLQVTEHKGETWTQRWKLSYRFSETLVIDEVTMIEGAANEPGGNQPLK
jgi:hypothetical protein